jgi:hypothetical protein
MWLKFFYQKGSLKRKIMEIKEDMKKMVAPVCNEKFSILSYGAYYIDPKNYVFCICVQSDAMKLKLSSDPVLMGKLRGLLSKHEYPEAAIPLVGIAVESQETVDRESDGDWHVHFK